jgi:tRNA1(Val) A37 N6-methylase TrmN6
MRADRPATTDDAILGGRLRLIQPRQGHRFGHDAILLAAAVPARPGDRVVELGAGVGAASLALLARVAGLSATLVEIEPVLVTLASENIARNGFSDQARAVRLDVTADARRFVSAGLPAGCADHVFMNPPFNEPAKQRSPDLLRRRAHAAGSDTLAQWTRVATRLLRDGGTLALIWRSDGLADVLSAMTANYGTIEILPVHPAPGKPAIRVISRAVKNSRAPMLLWPALFLNDAHHRPSAAAEEVLRGGEALMPTRDDPCSRAIRQTQRRDMTGS